MDVVNWGILGASNFAADKMAPAIHAAHGARLAALATSSVEKAAPFQAFQPDLTVFTEYEALLADPSVDAVYIPLPNHMHVDWTLKAIAAGKHVLVEKPAALQAEEFDALIAARDASGLVVAEAYMIVHHPQWQRAQALYQDGAIGALKYVDAVFAFDNSADVANIRNRPETGGGSLRDIGVYTFGSTRFVTGEEPTAVEAHIKWDKGIDGFAHVTADFPSFRYSSVTSMRMHPCQEISFRGETGLMRLTAPFNAGVFGQAELELHRNDGSLETPASVTVERWTRINQYVLQVEAFGRSVREGAPFACPLEFSRGTQQMMDMAYAASEGST